MSLFISRTPHEKKQQLIHEVKKKTHFVNFLELRPNNGQAFCSFVFFPCWKCMAYEQELLNDVLNINGILLWEALNFLKTFGGN